MTYRTTCLERTTSEQFWDDMLTNYVLSGHVSEGESLVYHVMDMPKHGLQEKVKLLGSISNFHWWASFDLNCTQQKSTSAARYHQHLLFFPGENRKYQPTSPRNMLMSALPYLPCEDMLDDRQLYGYAKSFSFNLMLLVKYDLEQEVEIVKKRQHLTSPSSPLPTNEVSDEPAPKRRKYASRVISAGPEVLLEEVGLASVDGDSVLKNAVSERSLFDLFSLSMHSEDGFFQWRMHLEDEDIVVMNDYCPTSGKLKPLDYVHVKAALTDSAELQIKCTCKIYQYLQGHALQEAQLQEDVETVLDPKFTCMHCRFYKTYLQPIQGSLRNQDPVSALHEKLLKTDAEINCPVLLLGEAAPGATTKLSVAGPDSVSLVHIHFTASGCMAKCMDGLCYAQYHVKKRIPRATSLREIPQGQMCDHLYTLLHNNDCLERYFPHYFNSSDQTLDNTEQNLDHPVGPDSEPDVINIDDIGASRKTSGNISFNIHEGKWECNSHSSYTPTDNRYDPDLVRNTKARLNCFEAEASVSGHFKGPDLHPPVFDDDGQLNPCECGAVLEHSLSREVLVYTRQVTIVQFAKQSCKHSCM